jgi:hypothetical protein
MLLLEQRCTSSLPCVCATLRPVFMVRIRPRVDKVSFSACLNLVPTDSKELTPRIGGDKIMEDVMIRISVLWIFGAVAMSAHYVLLVFEPGALKEIISEETTLATKRANARLAIMEAFTDWLIPLTMAFLSVTLDGLANRNLNMVLGGLFTVLGIFHIAKCPIVHITNKPSVHQFLVCMSTVVVTALIF